VGARCWQAIFVATILAAGALGNWNDTSTGIDLDKLHHFPLVKIRSGSLKDGTRVTFDGITAVAPKNEREVRLSGVGKSGKRWEARLCCLDEVWRADLDGNGTQDYVFFNVGPYGNGRTAPPFSISILLMDNQGLPIPFFTTVYKGENGDGIKHVVDLDRDGHAELLISTYDEAVSNARVEFGCSGHWTTQAYQFKSGGIEEYRGTMGGLTFPFVHGWTYRDCSETETMHMAVQSAPLFEHGTSSEGAPTTLIRNFGENGVLKIDPVAGCQTVAPATIVYDRASIREISFPNLWSSYQHTLAETVQRAGAHVGLRGIDRWMGHGDCSANLMWAVGSDIR
jgi:hypothetical protein